jgi:hypothetical protein
MHNQDGHASEDLMPPPYVNETTTIAELHQAITHLDRWVEHQLSTLPEDYRLTINSQYPRQEVGELGLLRAVSVWQLYRNLKSIRGIRIAWDWFVREHQPTNPDYIPRKTKLLATSRIMLNFAFMMPTDFMAHRATQVQAFDNMIKSFAAEFPNDRAGSGGPN